MVQLAGMGARKKRGDDTTEDSLNVKRELFCWHYAKGEGTFGNATLSYAATYDIELGGIWLRDKDGNPRPDAKYEGPYAVCSSNGSRLLRNAEVQARIGVLLNELLKDDIVDAELAKVIMQDGKLESKIAAIRECSGGCASHGTALMCARPSILRSGRTSACAWRSQISTSPRPVRNRLSIARRKRGISTPFESPVSSPWTRGLRSDQPRIHMRFSS